jgi:hypothetical protein
VDAAAEAGCDSVKFQLFRVRDLFAPEILERSEKHRAREQWELPADLLKIDGSFIVNMNSHPANVAIVEAIVNLAGNLGMQTIAEWAEDTATVQTLAEIGVDYVQGYVVARPQAPEALLGAESSASFIRDEQLLRFSHVLGKTEDIREQVDLFDQPTPRQVH